MTNDIFDPLGSAQPAQVSLFPQAAPDSPAAFEPSKPLEPVADLSNSSKINFADPEDPLAVRFGSTADPMQLDMDPFGKNTVEWGKANGEDLGPDYVKSANIFGKAFTREQLESSEAGRKLLDYMEANRAGRRRGFLDAITDWQPSDAPFLGMFASVGKSIEDAITVHETLHKMQEGKEITDDEALKTRLYFAEQEYMGKGTWGATVGDIIRAAPGFMTEFWGSSKILGGTRALIGEGVKDSPTAAAHLSIDRATKYATREAVDVAFKSSKEGVSSWGWKKVGGKITDVATDATESAVIKNTKEAALKKVLPLYREKFGSAGDLATRVAEARIETELGRNLFLNSSDSAVGRWARGSLLSAQDHLSRAVLDFGHYGTEAYSATNKELNSALKNLGQAFGILGLEAPVRGGLLMLPQQFVVKPAVNAAYGRDTVSAPQLSLEAAALREGNETLMKNAESIAMGINFLEYASEQTGQGFSKLFRSVGLGVFGAKAMGEAAAVDGILPREVAEAAGSRLRSWINKAVGTTDDFLKGHISNQIKAVSHALEAKGASVADDAIETFIRTGNKEALGEAASAIVGEAPAKKFITDAVRSAIKRNEMDMTYRGMIRYTLADIMARNKWGPQEMTNWLRTAGYDGIVEEMMEERYSDFVKGLFGLDERAAEDKGFIKNIEQAFSNLNPGWEQLTAEAVGFAVPMGVRTAVFQIQKAAGGSDLSYVQNYASTMREFRGANNIVESRAGTHFTVAQEAINSLRAQAEAATDPAEKDDLNRRADLAQKQYDQQASIKGAADYNAEQIMAFEAPNIRGDDQVKETPTAEQAKRGVQAQNALLAGAARAGEILARGRKTAVDPKKMPLAKRIVSRVAGIFGGLVTGDLAMTMYDPTAWAMSDQGFNPTIVGRLADAYDAHYADASTQLRAKYASEVAKGSRTSVEPTADEIRAHMAEAYDKEARAIVSAYMAAQGIRIFSNNEMLAQAQRVVTDKYGSLEGHEAEVTETRDKIAEYTLRLLSNGAIQSSDLHDITRGIINLTAENPFADDVILDATMRLAGFQGLEETCELHPEHNLEDSVRGRSVEGATVSRVAGYSADSLDDAQQKEIMDLAVRLGYRPQTGANGRRTLAYSKDAILRLNKRVIDLCKKAVACTNPNIRTYTDGKGEYIRVAKANNIFKWVTTDATGKRTINSVNGEAALKAEMDKLGMSLSANRIVFTPAREIRCRDSATMLSKLGLEARYVRMSLSEGATKDDLVENMSIHPAFRYKRNDDGTLRRYTLAEAQEAFNKEFALAVRYRDCQSMSDIEKINFFRDNESENDLVIRDRIAEAERYWRNVFGTEQEKNGYLNRIDKLLSAHGVQVPGANNLSYSRYLAGQSNFYTLNTRLLNFADGAAYVCVNLNRDIDYDGALLSRAITTGLTSFRDLWAYNPKTKTYPAFATVLRDFVKRAHRVATDLHRASAAEHNVGEKEAMSALMRELFTGTNLESPKMDTIVWLARNVILGQADREAIRSEGTSLNVNAAVRLSAALRQSPEFYPFLGFIDLVMGGNGFANVKEAKFPALRGVAALARAFSGDEGFSMADLLKKGMLPMKGDGTRMTVPEFMEKINSAIAFIGKKQMDIDQAQKKAEEDPVGFIGDIMRSAGLKSTAELKDFMNRVLVSAGIAAGNTADLRHWKAAVEDEKTMREALAAERRFLKDELDKAKREVERLKRENAALAQVQAAQARVDVAAAELNAANAEAKPEVTEDVEVHEDPAASSAVEAATDAVDVTEFGAEEAATGTWDEAWDSNGADDIELSLGDASVPTERVSSEADAQVPAELATMSPEAQKHMVWAITSALAANGKTSSEAEYRKMVKALYPCLSDADTAAIFGNFTGYMATLAKEKDDAAKSGTETPAEQALMLIQEYLDDEGKHISDSEGFNDKAVAAYNSLKPMLEMMEAAVPHAKRNFQALVTILRDEINARLTELTPEPVEGETRQPTDLEKAYQTMRDVFNPRSIDINKSGASLSEKLAVHTVLCDRIFGTSDEAKATQKELIRLFTAPVKCESGITRPENAHLAAFLSFLSSLSNAGTRKSIMLLVSSSANCDAVSMDRVFKQSTDETDPLLREVFRQTNDLVIRDADTGRGAVSINMAIGAFLPLVGKSSADIGGEFGQTFAKLSRSINGECRKMAYHQYGKQAIDESFGTVHTSSDDPMDTRTRSVATSIPKNLMLQDIETFRGNAKAVADVLAQVFGHDNPLSAMLTSSMLFDRMRTLVVRGENVTGAQQLRRIFDKFEPNTSLDHTRPAIFDEIGSILDSFVAEHSGSLDRDTIANTVQLAFSSGNLNTANVSFPGSNPGITNEWLTLINNFVMSMPDTVVPSRPVPGRSIKDSSVAVAARGPVPIVLRYMTAESDGPMSFRSICERIVREEAERDYWINLGAERGIYVRPNRGVGELYGFQTAESMAKYKAGVAEAVEKRIKELGDIDGIVERCLQTMTWPDAAHTPIMARNLSVDYSPVELGRACMYSYNGDEKNGESIADRKQMWYLPLFGGDHACNNLLQIPTARARRQDGTVMSFEEACRAVNDEVGITLMLTDTKRSAITSADAASIPMVGADVTFDNGVIPTITNVKTGECRLHVALNFAEEGGKKFSQEAMHGQTMCAGFGPDALRKMSKDPKLRIEKFHCIGTGEMLGFEKSASSVVDSNALSDGGAYAPGTMARAYADHILKYRSDESRKSSSDTITDEDSYKVGPLKSKMYGIDDGKGGVTTFLSFIKKQLQAGVKPDAVLAMTVNTIQLRPGKPSVKQENVALSTVLDGIEIAEMEGLNTGDKKNVSFVISYRDNSMMALKVANIAHGSKPHVGTNGKNYTVDALTKAVEQSVRRGALDEHSAQNQVITTLNSYAIISAAVAADPASVEADLQREPQLQRLIQNGADPNGMEYKQLRAQIVAKRLRKAVLSPVNKVDAVLTSCGATLAEDGTILDHSGSQMRRDLHKGSIVFSAAETSDGGLYKGFKRRFALAEVNIKSPGFRYGMFLDTESEGYRKLFAGCDTPEAMMQRMEDAVNGIVAADERFSEEVRKYNQRQDVKDAKRQKKDAPAPSAEFESAKSERSAMRQAFFSCFVDHHGENIGTRQFTDAKGTRYFSWATISLADLMCNDGNGGTRFDRTAFMLGEDSVTLDVFDYATGKLDEAKSGRKLPFLAGTAFGVPRTPSYNGGMWLQVARASLPVTETLQGTEFKIGDDALVALDPQTLDILGCDNDGDESALYMLTPDIYGACQYGDIERCIPDHLPVAKDSQGDVTITDWDYSVDQNARLESHDNRVAMLSAASALTDYGFPYISRKGSEFAFTAVGKRAVSNQLVSGLFDMARELEVPAGTERRNFASEISGRTKAQPFDDARYWKRDDKEEAGFDPSVTRLFDIMPPDVFTGKNATIGDPKVQELVSLSAKKSSQARGAIVSAASALHIAFLSGCFTRKSLGDRANPFGLFDLDMTPDKWQAFMRHFDGLSNATFDDVKERVCSRLGLTPEMVDTLVVDLLTNGTPTTDAEWHKALYNFIMSGRAQTPDGKYVWTPNVSTKIGQEDISRLFMAKTADKFDDTYYKLADAVLFRGARDKFTRMQALAETLGGTLCDDGKGLYFVPSGSAESTRGRIAAWFNTIDDKMSVIGAAVEGGGRNDMAGYLMWILGAATGNLQTVKTGGACDLANLDTVFKMYGRKFSAYAKNRKAWKTAKSFASALNYSQSDPGAPNARSRTAQAEKAYGEVMSTLFTTLTEDQKKMILDMRQATRMAYSCGLVNAETPDARAFNAAQALEDHVTGNEELVRHYEAAGSVVAEDVAAVNSAIIQAAGVAGEYIDPSHREDIHNGITSVPYVIAALQTLPKTGITKDYDTTLRTMRAISEGAMAGKREFGILGFRRGVESMFHVLYALITSSEQGKKYPGITYLGMRGDSRFSTASDTALVRGARSSKEDYGIGQMSLGTIFQTFAVRDEASLRRVREAFTDIIENKVFDKGGRVHRAEANRKYKTNAPSFDLSLANLAKAMDESKFFDQKSAGVGRAIGSTIQIIKAIAEANDMKPEDVVIRPSDFFTQILPLYMAATSPVEGTPSYDKFSSSLLAVIPGVYERWSAQQALNDRGQKTVSAKYQSNDGTAYNMIDALATLNFAPINVTKTFLKFKGRTFNGLQLKDAVKFMRTFGSYEGELPVRSNPENRTLVDFFARDGVLFKAARMADAFNAEIPQKEDTLLKDAAVVNAADVAEIPEPAPKLEQGLAQLVDGVRSVLGATTGLKVEVDGNTMVIRGQLTGEAALKKRGIAQPVNTVIRIDLCSDGFGREGADLNSPADATSICNALKKVGLDITPEDFLTRLSMSERKWIVSNYMPQAMKDSDSGVSLRPPSWFIDAKGVYTLLGAIKLRKAEGKTLYHEYFHSMVGMMEALGMFSEADKKALAKTYGEAKNARQLFDEEAAADAFAEFVEKKTKPKGAVAAFFERMYEFLKNLFQVMQNKGFRYNESVKTADKSVAREEILFNMVLSGRVMDSLDSPKYAHTKLGAEYKVAEELAENHAMERLDRALKSEHTDRFTEPADPIAERDAYLCYIKFRQFTEMGKMTEAALALRETVQSRGAQATTEGGETVPAEAVLTSTQQDSLDIAHTLGEAIAPGDGILGDTPATVARMQQLGHGIAQAIAQGIDAIDPAVKGTLESGSELSKIRLSQEIYDVVANGVYTAADALGIDLKAQDTHLKNLVYANMLHLYGDLNKALGYNGEKSKNPIHHAKKHKGEFSDQKEHISRYDVAAFLLTAGGLSYQDIAKDAMNRLGEILADPRCTDDLRKGVNHLRVNLVRILNKTGYKGDPLHQILAGVTFPGRDAETGKLGTATPNMAAPGAAAQRNRANYQFNNPLFQEALDLTVRTAFTLSSAKSLYRILGIIPESLTGEQIPGGKGARVSVFDRRTGEKIPAPLPNSEVVEALGLSLEDLLDDKTVVDPFGEIGLYVNNPGEWFASTIRQNFGGKPLRDMFQEEHAKLKGVTDKFKRVQNWWAMYLGENFVEGTPLLAVKKDKGHFVFENGSVSYDETGHDRTGFDNFRRRAGAIGRMRGITTNVSLDRKDKEVIDFWLKSAYFSGMGDKAMLTGIDGLFFDFKDLFKGTNGRWTKEDFSAANIKAIYNGSKVGRQVTKAHIMLSQLLSGNQLPDFVVNGEEINLYNRMVEGLVDAMNRVGDLIMSSEANGLGIEPADANDLMLKELAKKGLVQFVKTKEGKARKGTVVISCDLIDKAFENSEAYKKLLAAGRDASMLKREKLHESVFKAYGELDRVLKSSPWMTEGDGRHFNSFNNHMPFFAGNGVFMYYANRIGKDEKKDVSQRLNDYENSFINTLKADDQPITPGQTQMLGDVFRTEEVGQELRDAIRRGEYAQGTVKSNRTGLVLDASDADHSHRIAETIYRRLNEMAWEDQGYGETVKRLGGRGSVARMIDMYEQLIGERTSWCAPGMNATQMYQIHGILPANYQIFHAMNVKLEDAARTLQFRNTFVNFLFTQDEKGAPIAYAKPTLATVQKHREVNDGIPDDVWEYAARWWASANGRIYDESKSGRVNAARLYDELITANESKLVNGRHFRCLDGETRQGLSAVSDFAAIDDDAMTDDVNARNSLNGGEAYGYAKMLFNIKRVVGGKAQSLLMQRLANYSKTLSVQQSAFFPIATKFESSAAAVGFWTMMSSNFAPGTARKLDKATEKFDKIFKTNFHDTINKNFVGFKDIVDMMDTDDPFLADAINLCSDLGISLSDRLMNPYESDKAIVEADMNRLIAIVRNAQGDKAASAVRSMLSGFLFRGSERAFSYALNATKIATALQLAQKVQQACHRQGRAFNFVKEMKPYAAYLNAEIGGIDPLRYAWADPRFRRMMNATMFSWEWTKGAWAAGGGEILEEALGGGHFTNPETRAHMMGRWLRMYGTIMIGVPLMMQVLVKFMSKLMGGYDGDDDDSWWTWENEEKHNLSAFNITPLLKVLAKSELILKAKDVPVLGNLVPAYTGKDAYNTTGKRKYYMHFGKQGWEFFRWFTNGDKQFMSKLSMPLQRMIEGLLGYNPASREYDLPFSHMSLVERWLNPTTDGAVWNLTKAFLPFSWNAMSSYGDAGAISVLGPVSMGKSYMASIKDAQARLTAWAKNDRKGYSFGYATGKNRKRNVLLVNDILADAEKNGMDPRTILTEATGLAAKSLYQELYTLLPKEADDEVDTRALARVCRGLNRLNIVQSQLFESIKSKLERHNLKWEELTPEQKVNIRSAIKSAMRNPYSVNDELYEQYRKDDYLYPMIEEKATRQAGKGGDAMSNFLATDKVPETLFGFEVVSKNYTDEDLAFFKEYPEAGGYYDMENKNETEPTPPDIPTGGNKGALFAGTPATNADYSTSFETPADRRVENGKVYYYPTQDKKKNWDVNGYRRYWSAKQRKMIAHTKAGRIPEAAFLEGKKRSDAETEERTTAVYKAYGVDPKKLGEGTKRAAWDIVFNTGGDDFKNHSPKFTRIVDTLAKQMSREDAFTMAMALEQDSYGNTNYRRMSSRGAGIVDDMAASKNKVLRDFATSYKEGWGGATESPVAAMNEEAYGTTWAKHAAGMNAASAVADRLGLEYSAHVDK